ncbi:bifunctional 4-hydroxy-2-oxoglutarate aldolase/2-dehydro-3-deoxy-phosphogluconate aldolase [Kitasatospora sp. NPDC096147]|uniref:bifunctional 4-hydroxy-2-oxoglutarate aldolase/2-dehydro-3-deoxy-phosphogluconate aldolase n=1 Tax=Kitasatospora sp. NPDC096147 TaxID=3364093 RepID=UPI0037FEC253
MTAADSAAWSAEDPTSRSTADARLADALRRHPVVAILRAPDGRHLERTVHTLAEGGVTAVEITVTTPDALPVLARLRRELDDSVLLGIGTASTAGHLAAAEEAGCDFVVSPHTDPELIRAAARAGLATLPGALTPTEALAAHLAGATAVKLYPAGTLGPGYLSALRAPLPQIPFVPTGAVELADIPSWLAAGAVAVGLGGPLLGRTLLTGDQDDLRTRLRTLRQALTAPARETA